MTLRGRYDYPHFTDQGISHNEGRNMTFPASQLEANWAEIWAWIYLVPKPILLINTLYSRCEDTNECVEGRLNKWKWEAVYFTLQLELLFTLHSQKTFLHFFYYYFTDFILLETQLLLSIPWAQYAPRRQEVISFSLLYLPIWIRFLGSTK